MSIPRPVTYADPLGELGARSGMWPVMFRGTLGRCVGIPSRRNRCGEWDQTEMSISISDTHFKIKKRNEEGECVGDKAEAQPSHTSQRLTCSVGKKASRPRSKGSRSTPYKTSMGKSSRIVLKKMEAVTARVEKSTSECYWISIGPRGEPHPSISEMGRAPAAGSEISDRPSGDTPPCPITAGSLKPDEYVDNYDADLLDEEGDGDDCVVEVAKSSAPVKRGRGHPLTMGEHVGKREKDEERACQRKEEEREKRAKKPLSSSIPRSKK